MACFVRCSFLLISICLRSTSSADSQLQVTSLTGAVGNKIIIQCAAGKTSQNGVYMYKQARASTNKQKVFYYYKEGTFTPKSPFRRDSVQLHGTFPNFNVTVFNVNASDSGFYWCEFNLSDKITVGKVTWLSIEESVDNKTREVERKGETERVEEIVCPEDIHHHVKIVLVVCAVMLLLCITGFIFVILKVKGCWKKKKYRPSNTPADSVYEEMKRSNLDAQPSAKTFINPDYQSTEQLR